MPLSIVRDDITHVKADALVNAANEQLRRGGGVCGAIFAAAGARKLQDACDKIGHCDTGQAVATPAFRLPARYVIHAVGPVWAGGTHGERELLASCYRASLGLAVSLGCTSVAFPLISAGIYGYPRREALEVAQREIRAFLDTHELEVTLVLYDAGAMEIADDLRLRVARYIDDVYVGAHARQRRRLAWEGESQVVSDARLDTRTREAAASEGAPGPRDASATPGASSAPVSSCPMCGTPVFEGQRFCVSCGAVLPADVTPGDTGFRDVQALIATDDTCTWNADDGTALLSDEVDACGYGMTAPTAVDGPMPSAASAAPSLAAPKASKPHVNLPRPLRNLLDHLDAGFSETLLAMIDKRGLRDAEVYKRANISRQHFSKIRSNPRYRPTKTTVLALAVALELSPSDTALLLERAGFALSHADKRDVIVEFFICEGNYDIFEINDTLFAFDQPLLG